MKMDMGQEMHKKIAVIVVLALAIGIAIGFSFSQLLTASTGSFLQGEKQNPAEVTVIAGQIANITFENGDYTFTYKPDYAGKFYVITPNPIGGSTTSGYTPEQGAVYYVSGIKITVSSLL